MNGPSVAIVGGGASGTLQALHLIRAGAGPVTMIERSRVPGRGVAYSTGRPEHLLNVTARRMSAFPDDPEHFARWYGAQGGRPDDYAPRMLYGDYLEQLLAEASPAPVIMHGEAIDISSGGAVKLADGSSVQADTVVLAPGNFTPATPRGIDAGTLDRLWVADPWAGDIGKGLKQDDTVLLLGTGLTAVDAILTLDALGFTGRILALSRRGLAPRGHAEREAMGAPAEAPPPACVPLLRGVRRRSAEIGWRSAIHELRSVTQGLWAGAPLAERERFLRHLRPWWDVHRHRIAPPVAARVAALEKEGRLQFAAGKLVSAQAEGDRATIRFRRRGTDAVETVSAARIVNCTGPETDIVRSDEPLLKALLAAGRIRPDPTRIGLEVDLDCRALDASGRASDRLYAIGPVTRGAFWESVAVPDIGVQAQHVAARICA